MERYEDMIERALILLKQPSRLSPTGSNPIVYLTYQPEEAIKVRSLATDFLPAKAEYYGLNIHFISLGEIIDKFINNHEYHSIWTTPAVGEGDLYKSIRQEIESQKCIENAIFEIQDKYLSEPNTLLVLRDVEMLHPFYMMGVIENNIYNKIKLPILVLYPGESQGTARSFLSIYKHDGNYRSINI